MSTTQMTTPESQNEHELTTAPPQRTRPGQNVKPQRVLACISCQQRKIKCDRQFPCGSCTRSKQQCVPVTTLAPRQRRRRFPERELLDRLRHYEDLLRQHNIPFDSLHGGADSSRRESTTIAQCLANNQDVATDGQGSDDRTSTSPQGQSPGLVEGVHNEVPLKPPGKLLTDRGKSRYIDSNLWHDLGVDEWQRISDDEDAGEDAQTVLAPAPTFVLDPLTGALLGVQQNLLSYHPTQAEAKALWRIHIERVEPICKVLHVPTVSGMVDTASRDPAGIRSKADECLLFAIYHFAVFAMTDEEVLAKFGEQQTRSLLLQRYDYAARQAFINASFLKTTEMAVVQALVLYLLPSRHSYDISTYWILTGVANRLGRRLGLHRDGDAMGLPPFETQMRRRLFYQLIPLDGIASQHSGAGMSVPSDWDAKRPLNINDSQIWPGMTEPPEEIKGATEMMFCQARSHIGSFFARIIKGTLDVNTGDTSSFDQVDQLITQAENEIEEGYIRYCDAVDPLHFLTICSARSAITAMRLRIRLARVRNHNATDQQRQEAWQLSLKVLDTETAAYSNTALKRFAWHMRGFFIWGSIDALIFALTSLRKVGDLEPAVVETAWTKVEQAYCNHAELLDTKRDLPEAVGRCTLDAWNINPPRDHTPEPAFITSLRASRRARTQRVAAKWQVTNPDGPQSELPNTTTFDPAPIGDVTTLFQDFNSAMELDPSQNMLMDTADDWMFWDQLIQDFQAQGDRVQSDPVQQPFAWQGQH